MEHQFDSESQNRQHECEFPPDHPLMRGSDEFESDPRSTLCRLLNKEAISEESKRKILQIVDDLQEELELRSRNITELSEVNRSLTRRLEDTKQRLIRATRSGSWNF